MRIIDNLNEFACDDLKASIKPGAKLRIAARSFDANCLADVLGRRADDLATWI